MQEAMHAIANVSQKDTGARLALIRRDKIRTWSLLVSAFRRRHLTTLSGCLPLFSKLSEYCEIPLKPLIESKMDYFRRCLIKILEVGRNRSSQFHGNKIYGIC